MRWMTTGFFLAVVLVGGALAGVGLERRLDQRDARFAVRALALTVEHDVKAASAALTATANRLGVLEARPVEVLTRALDELTHTNPMLQEVAVVDATGTVLAALPATTRTLAPGVHDPSSERRAGLARPGVFAALRAGTSNLELGARVGDLAVIALLDLDTFRPVLLDAQAESRRATCLHAGELWLPRECPRGDMVVVASAGPAGLEASLGAREDSRPWLLLGLVCVAVGVLGLGLGGRPRGTVGTA